MPRAPGALRLCLVPWLLGCEPLATQVGSWNEADSNGGVYLEAEAGTLSGGFSVADDASASAAHFLLPPAEAGSDLEPGPARASYAFSLREEGEYRLWGRIRSPDAIHNRFWVQLDGGSWVLWRISVGDIWYWDDVHVNTDYGVALNFPLLAGKHELVLANAANEVGLDRLYVTADGDEPPGNDTACDPPHSISVAGECLPSCGGLGGTACSDEMCAGKPLLAAYDCAICCRVDR